MLEAVNLSLVGWQEEWTSLGKIVDDYENATRRRIADAKYETRTRNLNQHGINHEEPEFVVRGYKAKERETMSETRYLQAQDRIMAAAYGFEYDPHPSKIGRQNPETQQAGVTTRGRSLRNQPRQTVKASEADGVAGKRQRKPVQLFDPAPQEVSRSSTPVPTRGRRRKNANADGDDVQTSFNTSFNDNSDGEASTAPIRRKRGPKPRASRLAEDSTPANGAAHQAHQESPRSTGRRGRQARAAARDEDYGSSQRALVSEPRSESMQPGRRMLTLKIPRGKNFSEPSSAITDNGDSRPSTASSDSTSHTIESSYSFRPKRQKRFRDEPDDKDGAFQGPPKKRNRRVAPVEDGDTMMTTAPEPAAPTPSQSNGAKRGPKIKLMRPSTGPAAQGRNGTPVSQPATEGAEEPPKEYRAMTKSEKMSASMKSKSPCKLKPLALGSMLTRRQVVGQMATWLAPWRSARPHWRRRRPPRQPLSSDLASSLQSPRARRVRRGLSRYPGRIRYSCTLIHRRLIPIFILNHVLTSSLRLRLHILILMLHTSLTLTRMPPTPIRILLTILATTLLTRLLMLLLLLILIIRAILTHTIPTRSILGWVPRSVHHSTATECHYSVYKRKYLDQGYQVSRVPPTPNQPSGCVPHPPPR